uniref:Uncharacterized protein n=1 Tax=Lotharella oceanica TaxID=641309 RepID=A0A7S2U095_9EUKA|mmetsp:Transcript_36503/g.67439  ORF Transcript_36503/g.67439 Transcript_36503/m.67439 type:complete len:121 (+) Transcript_36503:105-467(+)
MYSKYSSKARKGAFSFLQILTVAVVVGLLYVAFSRRPSSPPLSPSDIPEVPGKDHWPELVGVDAEKAVRIIKSERPDLKKVLSLPIGSMVTMDYRLDRVRVFVSERSGLNSVVAQAPRVG